MGNKVTKVKSKLSLYQGASLDEGTSAFGDDFSVLKPRYSV